jgi:hypothetical protein
MSPLPTVTCSGCAFEWNSTAMAEGLRLLGSCPRCGGELRFRGDETLSGAGFEIIAEPAPVPTAPHLVLGIPRR